MLVVILAQRGDTATGDEMPDDFDTTTPITPIENFSERLGAFMFMIGAAEVGLQQMRDGSAFQTFYGGTLFHDMTDHPVLTGEKVGIRLSDAMCRAAGYGPGCVSTAAGFAQINVPTWRQVREAGAWGPRLPDFGVESQMEAARRVLMLTGGYEALEAGNFDAALSLASQRWASLPGSRAQQNPKNRDTVVAYYEGALYG